LHECFAREFVRRNPHRLQQDRTGFLRLAVQAASKKYRELRTSSPQQHLGEACVHTQCKYQFREMEALQSADGELKRKDIMRSGMRPDSSADKSGSITPATGSQDRSQSQHANDDQEEEKGSE
jgi:hypothetical protein